MKYVPPTIVNAGKADQVFCASRRVHDFSSAKGEGMPDSASLPTLTVGAGYTANC
jgi:hypothetical protein